MKFFLDNCISIALARAIGEMARSQGIEVIHLSERFGRNTPDVDWITALRDEDWIIVSGDTRITRNPVERAAWQESGLTAFFLDNGWSSKRFWIQAAELVRWWPVIMDTAKESPRGAGYLLPFQGKSPKPLFAP